MLSGATSPALESSLNSNFVSVVDGFVEKVNAIVDNVGTVSVLIIFPNGGLQLLTIAGGNSGDERP